MAYTKDQLQALVANTAAQYGIDQRIALAQVQAESAWNPNAVSPAGAQGLFQFMPGTWATWGNGSPFNPDDAAPAYGRYFSHILNMYGWNYGYALAGYNWGENRNTLKQGYAAGKDVLSLSLPTETRNYVQKILSTAGALQPQAQSDFPDNTQSGLFWPIAIGIGALVFLFLTGDD